MNYYVLLQIVIALACSTLNYIHLDLYTHQSLKIPTLFQIHTCLYHHTYHMNSNNPIQLTSTYSHQEQKYNHNQSLWHTLTAHSLNIPTLTQPTINSLEELLSQMLQLPQSIRPNEINQKLHVLIQIFPIPHSKIHANTLQMLCLVLQNIPNCAIHYFLKHSCFWRRIDQANMCEEQQQGYCRLMITLFQHRQKITTKTNMQKLIDLIPRFYKNVSNYLIIKLCVRLVMAIEHQNEDKDGLCYRIYSQLRPDKTILLAFIQQLQKRQRINTSKLLKNSQQILSIILQDIYNHTYHDSHLSLLELLIKREELSQDQLHSIMSSIVYPFYRSDCNHKKTIIRVLYALYESQLVCWYFRRDQTIEIVSLLVEHSISAIQSKQILLVDLSLSKLYRYLNGEDGSKQQYKLKTIFYNIISKSEHINQLAQIQKKQGLQISHAVRRLLQLIKQGYSDSSHTFDSLDLQKDQSQELQLQLIKQTQSQGLIEESQYQSSALTSYECSDSYF